MQLKGRTKLEALGRAINAIEGGLGEIKVIEGPRGLPSCRYRVVRQGDICLAAP
jgi:hypothetical protein